jgi:hypothetical protein
MLRIDRNARTLTRLAPTPMAVKALLERAPLRRASFHRRGGPDGARRSSRLNCLTTSAKSEIAAASTRTAFSKHARWSEK